MNKNVSKLPLFTFLNYLNITFLNIKLSSGMDTEQVLCYLLYMNIQCGCMWEAGIHTGQVSSPLKGGLQFIYIID